MYALDVALANMVVFDTDLESCQKAATGFANFSRNMLQHCVCAVDGLNLITIIYLVLPTSLLIFLYFVTLSYIYCLTLL